MDKRFGLAALAGLALAGVAAAHEAGPARVLDKPAQRAAGLRTVLVEARPALAVVPARVVADPRGLLRIAAAQPGTVVLAPGLQAGAALEAGALLGWFEPALTTAARNEVAAERATAQRDAAIGRVQVERFHIDEAQQFEQKLPTPTLQILTEYRSATGRSGALELPAREALRVPRAGRLLRAPAAAGQLYQAGDALFEIDAAAAPALLVEAIDDDLELAAAREATTRDGRPLPLVFLGSGYDARARAHRALYAPAAGARLPAINDSVRLAVPRGAAAIRVPAAALSHTGDETRLWVQVAAERFESREVEAEGDAAGLVRITRGLLPGERVAVAGFAALAAAGAAR